MSLTRWGQKTHVPFSPTEVGMRSFPEASPFTHLSLLFQTRGVTMFGGFWGILTFLGT